MRRKERLLLVLLAGLAISLVYAWLSTPRQQRVTDAVSPAKRPGRTAKTGTPLNESLRLDLLLRDETGYEAVRRDIFNFYVPPAPKPAPKKVVPPPSSPPPPPPVAAPPPVPVVTAPPPTRFRLLGMVDTGDRMRVFLTDEERLFVVGEGDVFGDQEQYTVETLTPEEVQIRQAGRSALIRISLRDKDETSPAGMDVPDEPESPPRRPAVPAERPRLRSFKRYQP